MSRPSLVALVLLAGPAAAQSATEDQRVVPPLDPNVDDFGVSIAVDGDWAIVGDSGDDEDIVQSGAAHILRRVDGTWQVEQKLKASDVATDAFFGRRVAIDGDRAVVSATHSINEGAGRGSIYVFERSGDTWSEVAELNASDPLVDGFYGWGLDLEGDRIAVGAHSDDGSALNAGRVFVYERQPDESWLETADFVGSETVAYETFGNSVALSGTRLLIGAPEDNMNSPGKAYVFELRNGQWVEDQILYASDGDNNDLFGCAVDLEGGRAIVGARYDDDVENVAGSAYLFERQGDDWVETQRVTSPNQNQGAQFGWSVVMRGPRVIVGAYRTPVDGKFASGTAYLFARSSDGTWDLELSLNSSEPAVQQLFGYALAMDEQSTLAGGPVSVVQPSEPRIWAFDNGTLYHGPGELSLTTGGTQDLFLRAGEPNGGRSYWMLGSVTGTAPGVALGSILLPLNYDPYFQLTLSAQGMVASPGGVLDAAGRADLAAVLPPGLDPVLAGVSVSHAYLVFDGLTAQLFEASNAVSLTLTD